ncbi:GyrI-like domain-containing protein [Ferruginibacter paludis]|uniref:GyrI-like domain-containing protein n=1 Tax=Ferruginibacter paludis TaxID=1310417 RepID=UPI0025B38510|nr:GyrI-like domain-containing protein [Ferruginibacter paludis]MDN3654530.1 GyrI-like domain-containing protein [Ferruginibacter paludis]
MNNEIIKQFNIIGIAIRTTNDNGQSSLDIPSLWNKFMGEGMVALIPDKINNTIYCVYTDYEKDHTKPYTTILGCSVSTLNNVPEGMVGKTIEEGAYIKYTAKGNILQGMVFNEWVKIWNSDIDRKYTADFEVYGEKAKNPEDAEVDIFIAVK